MFEFHTNKQKYFDWQYQNSKNYIVPFVRDFFDFDKELAILEIGSAEAGVLKAFTDLGHRATGIELSEKRVELANHFMEPELKAGRINFIVRDIFDIDPDKDLEYKYDLVILKDVIEHIHDQARFMQEVNKFLKPGGKIFFGFPPWYMPFGGHQQLATKKILSKLPYYHLLPMPLFKGFLKMMGEQQVKIENLAEIKECGISIERFERIVKSSGFKVSKRQIYFLNPIYRYKFNLQPRKQLGIIAAIPFLRNFVSTCVYYVIEKTEG